MCRCVFYFGARRATGVRRHSARARRHCRTARRLINTGRVAHGGVLWRDVERRRSSPGVASLRGRSKPLPRDDDRRASIRAMHLLGDASVALMVRAPGQQGYVVGDPTRYPGTMPACLE